MTTAKSFNRHTHIDAGFEFDVSKQRNGSARIRSLGGLSFLIINADASQKTVSLLPGSAPLNQLIEYLLDYYFGGENGTRVTEIA